VASEININKHLKMLLRGTVLGITLLQTIEFAKNEKEFEQKRDIIKKI
jgi:hypothetical protein